MEYLDSKAARMYSSPVGSLYMEADEDGLCVLRPERQGDFASGSSYILDETATWLDAYFKGKPLPETPRLSLHGTGFQHTVWKVLMKIKYGETRTYAQIAEAVSAAMGGEKTSARAIGQAVGKNPVMLIVPCHRVIGSDGSLTGFAYGVEMKASLLDEEYDRTHRIDILYLHGLGGGADSRIPNLLEERFRSLPEDNPAHHIHVNVRTYDFDPDKASAQIETWIKELEPRILVCESLGCCHGLSIHGIPEILISPALNAASYLGALDWMTFIPGVRRLFQNRYRPKEGDRQHPDFRYKLLHNYRKLARKAELKPEDKVFALFGTRDHYRKRNVVSLKKWRRMTGEGRYAIFNGTHFMEEEYIDATLVPMIISWCNI